jgi:proteic killer suppression protein
MLDRLDVAIRPDDMDVPGWRCHALRGDRKGRWAVAVSGNLRLTFAFDGEDAVDVDLEDYH